MKILRLSLALLAPLCTLSNSAYSFDFEFLKPKKIQEPQAAKYPSYNQDFQSEEQDESDEDMPMSEVSEDQFKNFAVLRIINKTTGKSDVEVIKVGSTIRLKSLSISPSKCWSAPNYQKPENKALLLVQENKNSENKKIFYGWMISSSPSVSTIEHPVYDITVIGCKN